MNVIIREGIQTDLPAVLGLINELAVYEKSPEESILTLEQFEKDGFTNESLYKIIVAESSDAKPEIVGMVLYYFGYSTWKGKMLYIDDIIVTNEQRQKKIGEKLFTEILSIAKSNHAGHLRFHVLDWNTPAINFYKKFNVIFEKQWVTCKLNPE
ncbi:MAG: GNAT family N-acetyltransferase [Bacteroidetes bacterium]|nr:GNAT family N-acetyltransferase [Bacteroidota bacterium]